MKYRNGWCGFIPNVQIVHDMRKGFPLITSRSISFKIALGEFLWAVHGHTNVNELNSGIWDQFADNEGELGPIYGKQWTKWSDYDRWMGNGGNVIDQLESVVAQLSSDMTSRRAVVSAWNVAQLGFMCLPPCQPMFQLWFGRDLGEEYNRLHITVFARSADLVVGFPYDFALYSLMLVTMAARLKVDVGTVTFFMVNAHIYAEHYENMNKQVMREPYPLPRLSYSVKPDTMFDELDARMYNLIDYKCHPRLDYKLIV